MLQQAYSRIIGLSSHRNAIWVLAGVSFIESSVFPIPPDVLLIPMVLAAPTRWFRIAFVCTIASVLGGLAGYAMGYFAFETIGKPIIDLYGYGNKFEDFKDIYNAWGVWIVFVAGTTIFPNKLITIASGVTQLDLVTFTATSLLARALRFFAVALLILWLGPQIRDLVEKRLVLVFTLFCVLLVGGFVAARYAL